MSFLTPDFFILFLPIVYLILFWFKNKILNIKKIGYILVMILMVIAMANPVIIGKQKTTTVFGSDVFIGLDLSYSMKANDIEPSRFDIAKQKILQLIDKDIKNRFALLGFTTNSLILSPLSFDTHLIKQQLSLIDLDQIITKGTDILSLLKMVSTMGESEIKTLIIFTDGGDDTDWDEMINFAKENNIVVFVMMVATNKGSTLKNISGELIKDKNNNLVISKANDSIEKLVDITGGDILYFNDNSKDFISSIDSINEDKKEHNFDSLEKIKIYYIPLVLALILFIVLTTSLHQKLPFFVLIFIFLPNKSYSSVLDFYYISQANYNINQKEYNKAYQYLENLDDKNWQTLWNRAIVLYKLGNFEKALNQLQKIKTKNIDLKSKIYYQSGVILSKQYYYDRAKKEFLKSMQLKFSKESYENYISLLEYKDKKEMIMKKNQIKPKKDTNNDIKEEDNKKKKSGGGANQKMDAQSSSSQTKGKKVKTANEAAQKKMDKTNLRLTSKQYELINKKVSNESKPW